MNFHVTKNDNGEAVDFFIRVTSPVARQKHGWHEYEIDGPTVADYCSLCGWQKKLHLSRVDYVTHRLRHGRFTRTLDWNDLTAKTNDHIIPLMVDNVFKSSPIFERLRKRSP